MHSEREREIVAYSCDLKPCSGGHPEWHIRHDILDVLNNNYNHTTQDGHAVRDDVTWKTITTWDMGIFHPDCRYLANSGVTWLYNKDGTRNEARWAEMKKAAEFFKRLLYAPIEHIVVENPVQHKYAREEIGVSWGQQIHPWQFGHKEQKPTGLWLKNVPPLKETNNVYKEMKLLPAKERQRIHYMPPSDHRACDRAKTYSGWANAMADQWKHLC
jgi:hypothetical protein